MKINGDSVIGELLQSMAPQSNDNENGKEIKNYHLHIAIKPSNAAKLKEYAKKAGQSPTQIIENYIESL